MAKKMLSGGRRMALAGKKPVLLGLTMDQHAEISLAAKIENRPVTQFITHYALAAAKKIQRK